MITEREHFLAMPDPRKQIEERIERIKAEISQHREAIKNLRREMKVLQDTLEYLKEIAGER